MSLLRSMACGPQIRHLGDLGAMSTFLPLNIPFRTAAGSRLTSNHFWQHGARIATWALSTCLL